MTLRYCMVEYSPFKTIVQLWVTMIELTFDIGVLSAVWGYHIDTLIITQFTTPGLFVFPSVPDFYLNINIKHYYQTLVPHTVYIGNQIKYFLMAF